MEQNREKRSICRLLLADQTEWRQHDRYVLILSLTSCPCCEKRDARRPHFLASDMRDEACAIHNGLDEPDLDIACSRLYIDTARSPVFSCLFDVVCVSLMQISMWTHGRSDYQTHRTVLCRVR